MPYAGSWQAAGEIACHVLVDDDGSILGRFNLVDLTAGTSEANVASQRVLLKAGFIKVGPADPASIGGKTGHRFERSLDDLA